MKLRSGWVFVALSLLTAAVAAGATASGCQSDSQSGAAGSGGGSGGDTSGNGASNTSMSTASSMGGSAPTSASTGTGANTGCTGPDATISDITTGMVGDKMMVSVKDIVVMSAKFKVSGPGSSGHCLWGVFGSTKGLTETQANTGILLVSKGADATTNDAGSTYCAAYPEEPAGDLIPDDVKIGDVLNVIGESEAFLLDNCMTEPNGSSVAQFQLSNICKVDKNGTAPVPTAHVLSPTEIAQLASPTDTSFHAQWGGVKVAVENVTAATNPVVGMYGIIALTEGNLQVTDKIYYRGYQKTEVCHAGPLFTANMTAPYYSFGHIEGFSYLDFCTWSLGVNDKCADFTPASEDCAGMTSCPQ